MICDFERFSKIFSITYSYFLRVYLDEIYQPCFTTFPNIEMRVENTTGEKVSFVEPRSRCFEI